MLWIEYPGNILLWPAKITWRRRRSASNKISKTVLLRVTRCSLIGVPAIRSAGGVSFSNDRQKCVLQHLSTEKHVRRYVHCLCFDASIVFDNSTATLEGRSLVTCDRCLSHLYLRVPVFLLPLNFFVDTKRGFTPPENSLQDTKLGDRNLLESTFWYLDTSK